MARIRKSTGLEPLMSLTFADVRKLESTHPIAYNRNHEYKQSHLVFTPPTLTGTDRRRKASRLRSCSYSGRNDSRFNESERRRRHPRRCNGPSRHLQQNRRKGHFRSFPNSNPMPDSPDRTGCHPMRPEYAARRRHWRCPMFRLVECTAFAGRREADLPTQGLAADRPSQPRLFALATMITRNRIGLFDSRTGREYHPASRDIKPCPMPIKAWLCHNDLGVSKVIGWVQKPLWHPLTSSLA